MSDSEYDIIVVGAGLAGLATRRALMDTPWRVLHLEKKQHTATAGNDNRGLAMAHSSRYILEHLGAWPQKQATEIRSIKISLQGQPGSARITGHDLDGKPLGYVVRATELGKALRDCTPEPVDATVTSVQVEKDSVKLKAATVNGEACYSAKLLIAADGTNSPVLSLAGSPPRVTGYPHKAIVCELDGCYDEPGLAIEHLGRDGPVAVLPLPGNKSKLVYCASNEFCERVRNLNKSEFIETLRQNTEHILPEIKDTGQHQVWPLYRQQHQGTARILPIGNAAMTVHPNAAQGYNLCLRDIAHLAEHIKDCKDPGTDSVLESWKKLRQADRASVRRLTSLLSSYYQPRLLPAPLYAIGLATIDLVPSLKSRVAWLATGMGKDQLPGSIYASATANC